MDLLYILVPIHHIYNVCYSRFLPFYKEVFCMQTTVLSTSKKSLIYSAESWASTQWDWAKRVFLKGSRWSINNGCNLRIFFICLLSGEWCIYLQRYQFDKSAQAPAPLSIFRSNSKFDENSKHSSVKYTRSITTMFCTRHDSNTVVTCAKYRCDRSNIFETRAFWIFIQFRIRSKYA